tara:strand:- start:39 stop:791 length:753 start_codon:yes stop_codon:yes gene_type:complete
MDKEYQQMLLELYNPDLLNFNSPLYSGGFEGNTNNQNTNNQIDLSGIPQNFLEQAIKSNYDFLPQFLKPAQIGNTDLSNTSNILLPKKKPINTGITSINLNTDPIAIQQGFVDTDEEDKEDFSTSPTQATGIAKLFEFLSRFSPLGLIKGGLESLKTLNQRIRDNDFAQSKTMEEYLEKKKRRKETEFLGSDDPQGEIITYDPAKVRNRQRIMNIQPTTQDKARGRIGTKTKAPAPKRDVYREAKSAFFR